MLDLPEDIAEDEPKRSEAPLSWGSAGAAGRLPAWQERWVPGAPRSSPSALEATFPCTLAPLFGCPPAAATVPRHGALRSRSGASSSRHQSFN